MGTQIQIKEDTGISLHTNYEPIIAALLRNWVMGDSVGNIGSFPKDYFQVCSKKLVFRICFVQCLEIDPAIASTEDCGTGASIPGPHTS